MQGGYLRIGPPQLKTIPIRAIDFDDKADKARHDKMVALVEEMLKLHRQVADEKNPATQAGLARRIQSTDAQIDALVFELYGLSQDEIALVTAQ